VPAINPDVSIIHAQRADREGNVQLWGLLGVQREAVLAAKASIVTVEEIVDKLTPVSGGVVIPSWVVSAVCLVSNGAHPSYASGYSERDNSFYKSWDDIAKDRESFEKWIAVHITGTTDFDSFSRSVGISALVSTSWHPSASHQAAVGFKPWAIAAGIEPVVSVNCKPWLNKASTDSGEHCLN
jgi:acyl CoA:acetate/3-ketoacid CoA transferase